MLNLMHALQAGKIVCFKCICKKINQKIKTPAPPVLSQDAHFPSSTRQLLCVGNCVKNWTFTTVCMMITNFLVIIINFLSDASELDCHLGFFFRYQVRKIIYYNTMLNFIALTKCFFFRCSSQDHTY